MQSKLICFVRASKFLVWVISLKGLLTQVKIKCSLSTPLKHIARVKVQLQSFVTSLLDWGGWLTSCPGSSSRGKQPRCPLNNSFWRTENPLPSTGSTLNYTTDLEIHSCEAICTSVWSKYFCQVNCCNSAHSTNLGVHLLQIKAYWRNASFEVTTVDLSRFPIFSDVTLRRWIGSSRHSEETRGFFFFFIYPIALQRRVLGPFPESSSVSSQCLHTCYSLSFPPGRIYHTVLPNLPWSSSASSFLPSDFHCLFWFSIILHSYHLATPLYASSFYIV